MLRVGLHRHTGLEIVGEADSVKTALSVARRTKPQMIVLDLQLADAGPRDAFTAIRKGVPDAGIVIYSARDSNREWCVQNGTPFFGKASDRLNDLIDWLRRSAAANGR